MNRPFVSIRADLGDLSDEGLVRASKRFVRFQWYPLDPNVIVLIEDPDGPTCYGTVVRLEGNLVEIRPDWRTFLAGPRLQVESTPSQVATPERTQAALRARRRRSTSQRFC